LLRKLIKSAKDKWFNNKDKEEPASPEAQIETRERRQQSTQIKAETAQQRPRKQKPRGERPSEAAAATVAAETTDATTISEPQRKRRKRKRPASKNRPIESPPSEEGQAAAPKTRWSPSEFNVAPLEGKTRFHDLNLPDEIMHGIFDLSFEHCTPIQAAILPKTLAGADASGKAQTGTGKTAAFLITIFTHLIHKKAKGERRKGAPRALIMVPTRELALQVKKDANLLGKYCRCEVAAIFGGMDYQKQRQLLTDKVIDVVVATPGRLLDFQRQGDIDLGGVEILVIDEADEMLNMGSYPISAA